jgi:hypothetical protein
MLRDLFSLNRNERLLRKYFDKNYRFKVGTSERWSRCCFQREKNVTWTIRITEAKNRCLPSFGAMLSA